MLLEQPPEHDRLIVLGVTANWAFAAGTVILALRRHNPHLDADILILHDGKLCPKDSQILQNLGCRLAQASYLRQFLPKEALTTFSELSTAKFLCFDLLEFYSKVLWLDSDILIQDSLEPIWNYGPLAIAREDPEFYENRQPKTAKINLKSTEIPDLPFDFNAPNYNSGVIVFNQSIQSPNLCKTHCLNFLQATIDVARYPDQGAFNYLHQILDPDQCQDLPQEFNCHPRNPAALYAPIVHAFGAYKLWNDGLTQACFPEWQRDYLRWANLGGSPYTGEIENQDYLHQGSFALLTKFFETIKQSQTVIDHLTAQLAKEKTANAKLTKLIEKIRPA